MRESAVRVLIRMPAEIRREMAREARERGCSINQLCLEAIVSRRALRKYNPWKAIDEIWAHNRGVQPKRLQVEIRKAISEVRHGREASNRG